MQKNVGGRERTARLVVGAVLAVAGIAGYVGALPLAFLGIGQALASVAAFLAGAILLATGYVQWCPISTAIGRNTYRAAEPAAEVEESPEEPMAEQAH